MADLHQLKQKYATVLALIPRRNVRLDNLHIEGNKLIMKGAAPNQDVKNAIWNAIKAVDPAYSDLACDLSIDSSLPAPVAEVRTYVVQAGDSLSRIAKAMYGDANQYMRIFGANQDKLNDPNRIQVGQELKIP